MAAPKEPAGLWTSQQSRNSEETRNRTILTMALFTSHANPKYFFFHPSHQIFRRMHGVLNIGKK
jgi:hypothetical protein